MIKDTLERVAPYKHYVSNGILSLLVVLFMPFIGSTLGLQLNLPNTFAGWLIYIVTKLLVVGINLFIFHGFMEQAKLNIRDNPKYIEANEILNRYFTDLEPAPRGPEEWTKKQYRSKGVSLAITTALSAVALTNAILDFDITVMLTYLFTVILGIIFGLYQMGEAESYWTNEYWKYAITYRNKRECEQAHDSVYTASGADILEPCDSKCSTSVVAGAGILEPGSGVASDMGGTIHASDTLAVGASVPTAKTLQNDKE